jgi:hypothetical protein
MANTGDYPMNRNPLFNTPIIEIDDGAGGSAAKMNTNEAPFVVVLYVCCPNRSITVKGYT